MSEPKETTKRVTKAKKPDVVNSGEAKKPDVVKLTHDSPCNMQGAVTLTKYRPDADGVITVDKRDASALRERFGWRDVDS